MSITIEVKQEEKESKDIFFNGNFVISNQRTIVMVFANISQHTFSGVSIKDDKNYNIYLTNWAKDHFTQFYGTITITSK